MPSEDGTRPAGAGGAMADEDLVGRAQAGDVAAFEALVERHEEAVYRLALRFVRNEADAQEVVQEAFLSAWRHLGTFEGRGAFGAWLKRVAANAALMLLRARRRHPEVSADTRELEALAETADALAGAGSDWASRPDEHFRSAELRRAILDAAEALPEAQRAVFLLRDVEELPTADTADALGLTPLAVKMRLHRARLALRDAITRHFAEPGRGGVSGAA